MTDHHMKAREEAVARAILDARHDSWPLSEYINNDEALVAARAAIAAMSIGEDALREALERIADYPATEGGDCFTLQRIARRALLATKHDRQDDGE